MRWLSSKVSTVGIFFAGTVLLIIYLLSMRWHIYLPVAIFWVAIALMLGTIVYQSLQSKLSSRYTGVILLEIAVTCLVFHLIYQIPYYGLLGTDVYMDMASVKGILSSGFVGGDPQYTGAGTFNWPMIHILGTQLLLITEIDLFSAVKWFPSLLDVALILLLYLLVRSIFKEEKIALLSALLFACLQHHILFSSLFVRETIALVLAVCCLYLCFLGGSSARPVTYYALSIVCLAAVIYGHHLSSFMLLIFLLIHFLVAQASELPFVRRTYFGDNITGERVPSSFLLLAFVALLAYWIGVLITPVFVRDTLLTFLRDVFNLGQEGMPASTEPAMISPASLQTARGYIIFYGFYFFTLILGAILLLHVLVPRLRNHRIEALSFTLFMFLCGIGGFMRAYVIQYRMVPLPDRFLMYGWLFGFAPLVAAILNGKHKLFRRIGVFLLIIFMLFNIYQIEPTAWDAKAVKMPTGASEEDYALARTFDFSTGEIADNAYTRYAIYDVHNKLGDDAFSNIDLSKYEWIIVQKEALRLEQKLYPQPRTETIAEMGQLDKEGSLGRNKIYESNNLSVFKLREQNHE